MFVNHSSAAEVALPEKALIGQARQILLRVWKTTLMNTVNFMQER